jgi:hypothetical protein
MQDGQTFQLVCEARGGGRREESVTCREADLIGELRRRLEAHDLRSIEVRKDGVHLFLQGR